MNILSPCIFFTDVIILIGVELLVAEDMTFESFETYCLREVGSIYTVLFCFFLTIYLFKRKRERGRTKGRGRGRGRKSQADSLLSLEPDKGLDLMTLRS